MTDGTVVPALFAVGAGLASVLSPCILPVIPVVVAGTDRSDRLRPLILVLGLSVAFVAMGVVSSLFGSLLVGRTRTIELAGSAVITALGVMVIADASFFKRFHRLANIRVGGEGRVGAFLLGLSLGLVWVPCVGPFLSGILTMVGTSGQLAKGVLLLGFYSLGLAIPILAVGYGSQAVRGRLRAVVAHDRLFRILSGGILVAFGLYSILWGNIAF
jgi:cytochrome c-type biogenesis protein